MMERSRGASRIFIDTHLLEKNRQDWPTTSQAIEPRLPVFSQH